MAEGILIVAMLVFALRGYFLGFVPLLSRLLGYGATYYLSYRYGDVLAVYIAANTGLNLGPIALRIGSSLLLFFTSMFVSAIVLSMVFKLLIKLVPPLKMLFQRGTVGSGLLGASGNAVVAAIFVLTGIWAYQLVAPSNSVGQPLNSAASRVGTSVNALLTRHSGTDLPRLLRDNGLLQQSAPATATAPFAAPSSKPGSAVIVSSRDPNKRLSLGKSPADELSSEAPLATTAQKTAASTAASPPVIPASAEPGLLQTLLRSEAVQELINNPTVQRFVGEQLSQDTSGDNK